MNDRPVAGILTALAVVPIVALCCLGPLVLGSAVLSGIAGWLVGWGWFAIVGAALVVGAVGYALLRRPMGRRVRAGISGSSGLPTRCAERSGEAAVARSRPSSLGCETPGGIPDAATHQPVLRE
jgi:hypothetical protein